MSGPINLIAIGRSRYLYDGICHLSSRGFSFKAIITEEAYEEYDIKSGDFETLAGKLGAKFIVTKSLQYDELSEIIKVNNIRVAISANWKYTISKAVLDLFECGILNFHLGNLPDYKGNATVNWTIINGEDHINGNIHKMDPELDAGDVIARKSIPIGPNSYIADLLKQAENDVPSLYEEAINKVLADPGAYELKGSVNGSRCYPRLPEDSQINWTDGAVNICRLVRASSHPYKGAFSYLNGVKIIIWKAAVLQPQDAYYAVNGHIISIQKNKGIILAACKDGFLEIQEIEVDGKVMAPAEHIKSIRLRFKYLSHAGN